MQVRVNEDSVEITGYVNSIERTSNTLYDRTIGKFIERIKKGAFKKALRRNDDVKVLLNHDHNRVLGSQKQGNLKLEEDNIGLRADVTITDKEVVEKAKNNELVGWSFGFWDREVSESEEKGMKLREVFDLDLDEVSILDRTKVPAYDGTSIMTRDNENIGYHIRNEEEEIQENELAEEEPLTEEQIEEQRLEELSTRIATKVVKILKGNTQEGAPEEGVFLMPKEEQREEQEEPAEEPKQQEIVENIDYSEYEELIKNLKEEN